MRLYQARVWFQILIFSVNLFLGVAEIMTILKQRLLVKVGLNQTNIMMLGEAKSGIPKKSHFFLSDLLKCIVRVNISQNHEYNLITEIHLSNYSYTYPRALI